MGTAYWEKEKKMRMIDADELAAELIFLYEDRGWYEKEIHFSLVDMRCNIDIMPTVDAVKHGHWDNKIIEFDVPHTIARCSVCKGKVYVFAEDYIVKYPYCPLCGAKMDEVEE